MRFWLEWNLFRWIINGRNIKIAPRQSHFFGCCVHISIRKDEAKISSEKKNDFLIWKSDLWYNFDTDHLYTHTQWIWIHLLFLSLWCVSRCHHFFLWSSLPRRFYKNTHLHTQPGTHSMHHTIEWIVLIWCCLFAVCLCWVVMLFFLFIVHFISGSGSSSSSLFYLHFVEPKFKNPQWRTKTIVLAVCVWLFLGQSNENTVLFHFFFFSVVILFENVENILFCFMQNYKHIALHAHTHLHSIEVTFNTPWMNAGCKRILAHRAEKKKKVREYTSPWPNKI